ncbi:replicative DNA helicase [Candidatus Clostridium stratigraminis]|uniref:Replicative DNA helicase n=1 Tax=Candidatus Clostridium stratigraminis TaxID=3381661 RepID=A0ABW8T8X3_9CLOT
MAINTFYNLEAEAEVLGSIMNNNNSLCNIIDFLSYDDFYSPKHQIIYKAMVSMYEDGSLIDITTLCDRLGVCLTEAGGITYISQIFSSCISAEGLLSYGSIVKEKSNKRKLMKTAKEMLLELKEKDIESSSVIEAVQDKLINIKFERSLEDGKLEEPMIDFLNKLEERWKNGGDIQGIKCGYKSLDKVLGGFKPQDFIIIAARPSMGKTAVALNLALNCALRAKAKTAFFNLEMGKTQIIERAIASYSEIPMENIKKGSLNDAQWALVGSASSIIASSSLMIFDKIFTLRKLKEECKRLKLQWGLNVVFIDYLQLINSEERTENRTQDISKISRSLKLMAKELDITVISLSQLSRAPETRADHKPLLSDLRESGAIEQDADIVMFLYRDEYYKADSDRPNTIDCIVAKNRNGQVGTARLKWSGECQKVM